MSTPNVPEVIPPAQYRCAAREHLFPSDGSLTWYMRQHKAALVDAGALLMHGGRWLVHADKFDAYVVAAGVAAAQRHVHA